MKKKRLMILASAFLLGISAVSCRGIQKPTNNTTSSIESTSTTVASTTVPATSTPTTVAPTTVPVTSVSTTVAPTTVTYTVVFHTNCDINLENESILEGGIISTSLNLQREGYTLDGWYKDEALTTLFDLSTPVNSNLVLYAKWNEVTEEVWTKIVSEDFSNTATIGTQPVTDAFYYDCGGSDIDSKVNNLNVANGVLNIYDHSTVTTYGYYKLGTAITTGKVKISLDITCPLSGKWSMLHFLGDGKDLSVRTNPDKKLTYYYYDSNGQEVYGSTLVTYKANTTFTVELLLDLDAGAASITINGTSMTVEGFMLECFDGIMLQTAGSSSRNYSIDNFVIQIA